MSTRKPVCFVVPFASSSVIRNVPDNHSHGSKSTAGSPSPLLRRRCGTASEMAVKKNVNRARTRGVGPDLTVLLRLVLEVKRELQVDGQMPQRFRRRSPGPRLAFQLRILRPVVQDSRIFGGRGGGQGSIFLNFSKSV